jgi:hypothetical protein
VALELYNIGQLIASVMSPRSKMLSTSATPYSVFRRVYVLCTGFSRETSYTTESEITGHAAGKSRCVCRGERNMSLGYSLLEHSLRWSWFRLTNVIVVNALRSRSLSGVSNDETAY